MSRVDLLGAAAAPLTARRFYADGDPGPIVAALGVDTHTVVALDTPLTREEVPRLRGENRSVWPGLAVAALVDWVDAVAGQTGPVGDGPAQGLREYFADHEIVELTLLIGATMMLNRFCTALALPTSGAVADRLRREELL